MRSIEVFVFALCAGVSFVLAGCGDDDMEEPRLLRTVSLVEHADTDVVTDTGAMGDSVGDVLTFANPLFDQANTKKVGTDQGYCIRTEVGKSWECEWTAFLSDGQITVAGPFLDAGDSTLAVTGGTGVYKNCSGDMALKFRNMAGTEFDFVYNLDLGP